jgi:hypothetical protein
MQAFLTISAEFIVIGFALIMAFDFIAGLLNLFATIQRNSELQSELQSRLQVNQPEDLHLESKVEPQTDQQPELSLSQFKIYKLRGESVVRVQDLNFEIPKTFKRYMLHKRDVIKLSDLELLVS